MTTPTEAQILSTAKTMWKIARPAYIAAGGSQKMLPDNWGKVAPESKAGLCAIAKWHLIQKAYKR